jgi:penicillin-binding protein 1A
MDGAVRRIGRSADDGVPSEGVGRKGKAGKKTRASGRKPRSSRKQQRVARPFKSFLVGFALVLLTMGAGGAVFFWTQFVGDLPSVRRLLDYEPPVTTRVLASDGSILAEFFVEKRYVEPIYRIPRVVQLAFVAAEDAAFYDHRGIDFAGIGRAALENLRSGETRQGASTITQQVVKALLLTPERTYERKVKEIILALRLEGELTKDEILYVYLNQIYLGSGAYGVQAAARNYFDKNLAELTMGEAALLAGLPQAPSRYSPRHHMERALVRQRYVLQQMESAGFITPAEAEAARDEPIVLAPAPSTPEAGPAPYFVEHVRRYLVARYGGTAAYKLGLDVHTTLDSGLQAKAERAMREGIAMIDGRQGFRGPVRKLEAAAWRPALESAPATAARDLPPTGSILEVVVVPDSRDRVPSPDGSLTVLWAQGVSRIDPGGLEWGLRGGYQPAAGDLIQAIVEIRDGSPALAIARENGTQGALLAMRPATGDILAMVGGLDYEGSEFNRATQAMRQPGSAFKPLIYTAALDRGYTPASLLDDSPVTYQIGPGQSWAPQNFSKRFHGPTTLRESLTRSRNVPTVRLTQSIGLDYVLDYLPRFGFDRPLAPNLSLALGTSEVSLLEMVEAYGVLANLGTHVEPRFITKITDREGHLVEEVAVKAERVVDADTAYIAMDMMRDVVERGTGRRARLARPVAGKTGTTNDLRDAWFIGYTPELLAGVWVGYDQDRTLGRQETGGRSAAPIWKSFVEEALQGSPVQDFPVPPGIVLVSVDRKTGVRTSPGAMGSVLEAFRRGTEPARPAPPQPAYAAVAPTRGGNRLAPDPEMRRPGTASEAGAIGDSPPGPSARFEDVWPNTYREPTRRRPAPDPGQARAWGDRPAPDPATRRWGETPPSETRRPAWGETPPSETRRPAWGETPPSETRRPAWGETPPSETRRPAWGAPPAPEWREDQGRPEDAAGPGGPHEQTNRWSRSLNARRVPSSDRTDPPTRPTWPQEQM